VSFTIQISEDADREWTEAAVWYKGQQSGLGNRFIEMVERKLELIAKYPKRYSKRKGNFPYIIVYSFYNKDDVIIVSPSFMPAEIR